MKGMFNGRYAVLVCSLVLAGCGGGGSGNGNGNGGNANSGGGGAPTESYINYLATNHAGYANTTTGDNPQARFEDSANTVSWLLSTQTTEQADNLQKHITFMINAQEKGEHPRAWDKLFLADAYLKQAHRYQTVVSVSGNTVSIQKTAVDVCTYAFLKAHATGLSGNFFEGNIKVNFTAEAEKLIASDVCSADRGALEAYIAQYLQPVPKGIQKNS
jgi:hypothetical protein